MRIKKQFNELCGINDDNILVLDVESQNQSRKFSITFPSIIKGDWFSGFMITLSEEVSINLNTATTTQDILVYSPYTNFLNIENGVDIKQAVVYNFYTALISSNNFLDVNINANIDTVSFLVDRSMSIKIVCPDINVLQNIITSTTLTTDAANFTMSGKIGTFSSSNFHSIDLVISSDNFNTVLRKTYLEGKDKEVKFNTRTLLNNMNLTNAIATKPIISRQFVTEGVVGGTVVVDSQRVNDIIWLPNNPNEIYNFDYSPYYVKTGDRLQKFLTLSPQTKYKKGSLFAISYLTTTTIPTTLNVNINYKNWAGGSIGNSTYSYSELAVGVPAVGFADYNNRRLDLYFQLPNNSTRFIEFTIYDGSRLVSETKMIELYDSCKPFSTMFFLNKIGGIDAFERFNKSSREKSLDENTVFYSSEKGKRNVAYRLSNYSTIFETELLNNEECEWAFDLGQSYYTYTVDMVTKEFKPFVITKLQDFSYNVGENGKSLKITIDE